MIAQHSFRKNYVDSLIDNVRNGHNLHFYALDSFPYDPQETVIIPTIRYPEGLLEKLNPNPSRSLESAIALYEAYPNLTPVLAADRTFWAYLSHVDLFQFVQARYPRVKEENFDNVKYILNHWFLSDDWIVNHPLASLWWSVYLTKDDKNIDIYKYTKFFFKHSAFRSNLLTYTIMRLKDVIFAYFDFLEENPEITNQCFKLRNRFITRHLNKLGGTRLLSTLNREFFTEELNRIRPLILAVTGTVKEENEEDDFV